MHKMLIKNTHIPLIGRIKINGSKNATLPIVAATLLSSSSIILHNVPSLTDVHIMSDLLKNLGARVNFYYNKVYKANHTLEVNCSKINTNIVPHRITKKLRASFLILGSMLSRFGKVKIAFPGGCNIGKRPVDMHIKAFKKMGAQIKIQDNNIVASVKEGKLHGKEINLEKISVGATQNIIIAATLAEGITVINNAAIEPEVLDLIEFLRKMDANITIHRNESATISHSIPAYTGIYNKPRCLDSKTPDNFIGNIIVIKGVKELSGCTHKVIPDRIEAGTYALASIITNGKMMLEGINISDIRCISKELEAIGAVVESYNDNKGIIVSRKKNYISSASATTNPYPNFPSDMQPQFMSVMSIARGISLIEERVFNSRFAHVEELRKLGANIRVKKNKAIINGVKSLYGTSLYASDLRSTAALLLASLVANGETIINNPHHLWRGYEAMHEKLNSCGANISISSDEYFL